MYYSLVNGHNRSIFILKPEIIGLRRYGNCHFRNELELKHWILSPGDADRSVMWLLSERFIDFGNYRKTVGGVSVRGCIGTWGVSFLRAAIPVVCHSVSRPCCGSGGSWLRHYTIHGQGRCRCITRSQIGKLRRGGGSQRSGNLFFWKPIWIRVFSWFTSMTACVFGKEKELTCKWLGTVLGKPSFPGSASLMKSISQTCNTHWPHLPAMERAERVLTLPNQSWAPTPKDKPQICVLERAPKGADGSSS